MNNDNVIKFIAVCLSLWGIVNILMKFMPEYATQLPIPMYELFYSITVNTEPTPSTKTMPLDTIDSDS